MTLKFHQNGSFWGEKFPWLQTHISSWVFNRFSKTFPYFYCTGYCLIENDWKMYMKKCFVNEIACFNQAFFQNRPKYYRQWKYVPQISPVWDHQNQLIWSLFWWIKLVLSAFIRLFINKFFFWKISVLLL